MWRITAYGGIHEWRPEVFQAQETPPGFAARIGASIQSGLTTAALKIAASHWVIMKADTPKFFVDYFWGSKMDLTCEILLIRKHQKVSPMRNFCP